MCMSKTVKVIQDSADPEGEDTDHLDESRAGGEDVGTDGLVSLVSLVLGLRFRSRSRCLLSSSRDVAYLWTLCSLSMTGFVSIAQCPYLKVLNSETFFVYRPCTT